MGFDTHHGASYHGSAALNITCRKDYQNSKGHRPRLGRAPNPALDVVSLVPACVRSGRVIQPRVCPPTSVSGATGEPEGFKRFLKNVFHGLCGRLAAGCPSCAANKALAEQLDAFWIWLAPLLGFSPSGARVLAEAAGRLLHYAIGLRQVLLSSRSCGLGLALRTPRSTMT